nr:estrogen receptor alpha [Danio rerio]
MVMSAHDRNTAGPTQRSP